MREVTCWHGDKGTRGDASFRVAGGGRTVCKGANRSRAPVQKCKGEFKGRDKGRGCSKRRGLGIIKILALALALLVTISF